MYCSVVETKNAVQNSLISLISQLEIARRGIHLRLKLQCSRLCSQPMERGIV